MVVRTSACDGCGKKFYGSDADTLLRTFQPVESEPYWSCACSDECEKRVRADKSKTAKES